MKKVIFLFITLCSLNLTSCIVDGGRDGRDGRDGKDGVDGFAQWDVHTMTIQSEEWDLEKSDSNQPYFYYDYEDPQLTRTIVENGNLVITCQYENELGKLVYAPLPAVRHHTDGTEFWTETFDYEYRFDDERKAGIISFTTTYSDFKVSTPPGDLVLKITYNW